MKNLPIHLFLLSAFSVCADTNAPPRNGPPTGWSTSVQGGSIHAFETDMTGGGGFSVNRYYIEGGLGYLFRADRMVSFSVGYGQDDYNFSGVASEPWNNIDNYRASIFTRWGLSEKWMLFAAPSIRSYGEAGVSLDDSLTAAVFGGATFRVNDRLTLGPGLGVVGQIEDRPRYFPVLIVDWKITDRLSLGTGGGLASTAGPGLTLSYKASRHWNYELSTRYEIKRFRLDHSGIAPNGVGEDRNIPLLGGIAYQVYPGTSVSGLFGYNFGGKLSLEDRDGKYVSSKDYDSAFFMGLIFRIRL
jgi:hypothetical protein